MSASSIAQRKVSTSHPDSAPAPPKTCWSIACSVEAVIRCSCCLLGGAGQQPTQPRPQASSNSVNSCPSSLRMWHFVSTLPAIRLMAEVYFEVPASDDSAESSCRSGLRMGGHGGASNHHGNSRKRVGLVSEVWFIRVEDRYSYVTCGRSSQ
jgi:hypothetical protein